LAIEAGAIPSDHPADKAMSETMKGSVAKLADEYGSNRRRTQRVKIAIPIAIRISKENASFYEEATETVVVNANGCLALLATPRRAGPADSYHRLPSKNGRITIRS
jgi:hypothetical protein